MTRSLVHLDADAFFASVEQAADPRLRGKPVAVGGEKRGIIASASYEARRLGIHTPMPTVRARKLCPQLILLPGDFEKYERFSRWMFSYVYDFTPDVEITSIDEGYFDLTGTRRTPVVIAQTIRQAIGQSLKISVSEGLGSNKLVSQIASKLHKPAAFTQILPGQETAFLHPLPNRWLPGVGPQTASRLNAAGLARIGQIAVTPPELLQLLLGRWAVSLRDFARGIDDRPLVPLSAPAQSYSHQETFPQDQTDEPFLEATLRHMADRLMAKIRAEGKCIRTLTVKVRYNDMDEDQRSESLLEPTDLETDLYPRLRLLLRQAWKRRVSLRMVSLKLSQVYSVSPVACLPLDPAAQQRAARHRLAAAVDELRHIHGAAILLRGHDFLIRSSSARPGRANRSPQLQPAPAPPIPSRPQQPLLPPFRRHSRTDPVRTFLPLAVSSYYSFLNSTLSPQAIVQLAQRHQLPAIALTDQANLHGAVPFLQEARAAGLRPVLGAELRLDGQPLWLYAQNTAGYQHLCRLLSSQTLTPANLEAEATDGLLAVSPNPSLAPLFPDRFYQAILSPATLRTHPPRPDLPAVAVLPVRYAAPADRWKFDIIQSIRTLTLLKQEHPDKQREGAFHFRSPAEMEALFREHPALVERTREIAERCAFDMPFAPPQFPAFPVPEGGSPPAFLRGLVFDGLRQRYPAAQQAARRAQLNEELQIIHEVGYEEYFLIVWDLLQECRRRGIPWITRGSAADSLVCYCLGISDVCPVRFDLYFHRFLNKERMSMHKLPDIDIDFPHDRKDDVLDLVFEKYGPAHAAVVGGFSTFQDRSALADIAKVLGVSDHQIRRFTERIPWTYTAGTEEPPPGSAFSPLARALRASPECRDLPIDEDPYKTALDMAGFLDGFPRYPKMHPCGVVLSRQPMHELTPTFLSQKGYPTTHFDMDAVEAVGLVKIDILAQGGLAVMRDVQHHLASRGITADPATCRRNPAHPRSRRRERAHPDQARELLVATPVLGASEPGILPGGPPPMPPVQTAAPRRPEKWDHPASPQSCKEVPLALQEKRPPNSPRRDQVVGRLSRAAKGASGETPRPTHAAPVDRQVSPPLAPSDLAFDDPAVWELIASGGARAVHHIESPAMVSLCRMTNVHDINGLIAIVSVIRPGAANEQKKLQFTRRYQGLEPVTYPHPSLAPFLKSTFGLVVYEEHILQICQAFAGLSVGRADTLRRALVKLQGEVITTIGREFFEAARRRGHPPALIEQVWKLVCGFAGYAFCKAHSTAYGVEAYQSAWLKTYFPADFMAAVLTHGKGFYHPLVYILECHRLGIPLLPPCVNRPGPSFLVEPAASNDQSPDAIRVPVTRLKGLTERTQARLLHEHRRGPFQSLRDFYQRVVPLPEEMEALLRVGAFDSFGQSRTGLFWDIQFLRHTYGSGVHPAQGWLLPPDHSVPRDTIPRDEPTRRTRLEWEQDLLGFPVSAHPLDLYDQIAWDTYCPVAELGKFPGQQVVTCGLVIEQRLHHQVTGEPMKFLTLADRTGLVETELFAPTYRSYGLATVRYPVLEITATVEPFENRRGFTLRVHRAGQPRSKRGG